MAAGGRPEIAGTPNPPLSSIPPEAAAPLEAAGAAADHILTVVESQTASDKQTSSLKSNVASILNDNPPSAPNDQLNPSSRSTFRLSILLVALFLSEFIAALDTTIVATAVPTITHAFRSSSGYSWIGGAYPIAQAVAAPIWAKLSDIWGRKPLICAAVALFFIASLICATANSMPVLIAGRALQGAAGGGVMLLVQIVVSDLFSLRRRSLLFGLLEGVWAVAGSVGPPLGGVFASMASWRWCFYINLPISGSSLILLLLFLDVKHERTSLKTGLRAIDWLGISTFLCFSLMVLLGLNFGGAVFAWDSAKVLALICVGIVMLGAFIYSEAKVARYPLIPLSVFRDKSNIAAFLVSACHGLAFFPGDYYLPLYLQAAKGVSPVRSGVLLIPLILSNAGTSLFTGIVIHKTGKYRQLIWAGTVFLCLGDGLFIMLDAHTPIPKVIGLTIIFGLGAGMLFQPPLIAVQARTKQADVATATSTLSFGRNISTAISAIVGGVVFSNSMDAQHNKLIRAGLPSSVLEMLSGKHAAANVGLANGQYQDVVRSAFAAGMRNMWIVYTALAAVGVVSGLFVGEGSLSREHTETVTGIKNEEKKRTEDVEMR